MLILRLLTCNTVAWQVTLPSPLRREVLCLKGKWTSSWSLGVVFECLPCWRVGCRVSGGAGGSRVGRGCCARLVCVGSHSKLWSSRLLRHPGQPGCRWSHCSDGTAKDFCAFKLALTHRDVHRAVYALILPDMLGLLCILNLRKPFYAELDDVCQLSPMSGGAELQRYCIKIRF